MPDQRVKKNLEALEKRFPGITELIEEKKEELLEREQIETVWEEAYSGERILRVKTEGRKLYLAGKRNPGAHAVNQIGVLGKIVPHAPVFIVGLGNPHYLRELLNRTEDSVQVLIYEPVFSIFYKLLEETDIDELFGNRLIALVVEGINEEGVESLISSMLRGDKVPIMKHFILPNYDVISYRKTFDFMEMIAAELREYELHIGTLKSFNTVEADNVYSNANYLRTGCIAGQLANKIPQDIPAIVVSAGPSLNKNIMELKKAKGRAFIIACDTALKPLEKAGIEPDMYAMLDGKKDIKLIQTDAGRKVPLLVLGVGNKALLQYHKGKKFFADNDNIYYDKMFNITGKSYAIFPMAGSVATMAFSLCCHLGCKTVIFVGQDLAFTGNKSHADGTFSEKMKEENTENFIMVPGNCGDMVPTRGDYNNYRLWFEDFIKNWKEKYTTRFINATEGGAKIEGTEVMTLREAIEKECNRPVDISACIDGIEPEFSAEEQEKLLAYFHNTPVRVHQMVKLAQECHKIYQKLDRLCKNGNVDKTAYLKLLKRIKKNHRQIEENENYGLLEDTMVNAEQIIRSSQYFEYDTIQEEGLELARQGKLYMELLGEYAKILEKLAEDTVAKVG